MPVDELSLVKYFEVIYIKYGKCIQSTFLDMNKNIASHVLCIRKLRTLVFVQVAK